MRSRDIIESIERARSVDIDKNASQFSTDKRKVSVDTLAIEKHISLEKNLSFVYNTVYFLYDILVHLSNLLTLRKWAKLNDCYFNVLNGQFY